MRLYTRLTGLTPAAKVYYDGDRFWMERPGQHYDAARWVMNSRSHAELVEWAARAGWTVTYPCSRRTRC